MNFRSGRLLPALCAAVALSGVDAVRAEPVTQFGLETPNIVPEVSLSFNGHRPSCSVAKAIMPLKSCLRLLVQTATLALSFMPVTAGIIKPIMIEMMTMTTSNSTSVNAARQRRSAGCAARRKDGSAFRFRAMVRI